MNNRLRRRDWHWSEKRVDFISTLLATLIGVSIAFGGAYFIAKDQKIEAAKQAQIQRIEAAKQAQRQEIELVIRLLTIAKNDADYQLVAIDKVQSLANQNNLNEGSVDDLTATLEIYSTPGRGVPYPIVFEKVIGDDRILRHLSVSGLGLFYSTQKALEEQRLYIMNSGASDRSFILDNYKVNLSRISALLGNEIKYVKGDLTESQVFEFYKEKEREIYGLTKEEQDLLLRP